MKLGIQTARAILNSLSAHVAILNKNGIIIETNRAWKQFARSNKIRIRPDTIHINYLEICDTALDDQSGKAQQVSEGIRSLINGEIDEFLTEYPCHGPEKKRWFYMRATRLADSDPLQLVVSHEDITQIKLAETALKKREKELEIQKTNHEETITALKVLLKQRDADRQELEERFVSNIKGVQNSVSVE
ncbi:MAG: hypothetical protein HUK40_05535 [Desulfobacter sp.]|nr:hypothetical protein [Desulfobacter sp.]